LRRKIAPEIMLTLLIFSMIGINMIRVTAQETHDIAVVSVTPSQTSVRLGELVNITVVVENQGLWSETFDITAYYDTTAIKTETNITIAAGANTSLPFTWNTTDVKEEVYAAKYKDKTYTINATASTVPGETATEDNTGISDVTVVSQYITVIPRSTVDIIQRN